MNMLVFTLSFRARITCLHFDAFSLWRYIEQNSYSNDAIQKVKSKIHTSEGRSLVSGKKTSTVKSMIEK